MIVIRNWAGTKAGTEVWDRDRDRAETLINTSFAARDRAGTQAQPGIGTRTPGMTPVLGPQPAPGPGRRDQPGPGRRDQGARASRHTMVASTRAPASAARRKVDRISLRASRDR